jgi:hypothetical protein
MPYHVLSRLGSLEPLLFAFRTDDLFLKEDRVRAVGYEGTKRGRVVRQELLFSRFYTSSFTTMRKHRNP